MKHLPVILAAAAVPMSTAWSQFTDESATVPVDIDTTRDGSYSQNGECVCSQSTKRPMSLISLDWRLILRSLCCSEVDVCTDANFSSWLQICKHRALHTPTLPMYCM